MAGTVIECEAVSKRYRLGERNGPDLREAISRRIRSRARQRQADETWALRDVSFELEEGDALGVVGRNGAGKSTLLKVLTRIVAPTSGVARTRGRVASLLEAGTGFHTELTGRENIYLNGAVLGMTRNDIRRRYDEIVEFAGLERFMETPIKRYSTGMFLRLAFSIAAHLEPDILLVDEVLAVGDAEFQRRCLGRVAEAEREGRTLLFVSHDLDAVRAVCSHSVWLERGEIRAYGPSDKVVANYFRSATTLWNDNELAGLSSPAFVVRRVVVTDASGEPSDVLLSRQPFGIELHCTVRERIRGLDVAFRIVNERGVTVLNEALSDAEGGRPERPGDYVVRADIPAVLSSGEYAVGVWTGTAYETLVDTDSVRLFRVEGATARADRLVTLGVPWSVTPMGEPDEPGGADHS